MEWLYGDLRWRASYILVDKLMSQNGERIIVTPASDMSDAAAAAAVETTPVEVPGFDRCRSLKINTKNTCKYK